MPERLDPISLTRSEPDPQIDRSVGLADRFFAPLRKLPAQSSLSARQFGAVDRFPDVPNKPLDCPVFRSTL